MHQPGLPNAIIKRLNKREVLPEYVIWGGEISRGLIPSRKCWIFYFMLLRSRPPAAGLPAETLKEKGVYQKGPVILFKSYLIFILEAVLFSNLKNESSPSFCYKITCMKTKLNIYEKGIIVSFSFHSLNYQQKKVLFCRGLESYFLDSMIRECFYVIYFYKNKWSVISMHLQNVLSFQSLW